MSETAGALRDLSVCELTKGFREGALSPMVVVEQHLARIAAIDPVLHAFQLVDAGGARAAAAASSARWQAGQPRGALDGVPLTIKDNMDIAGLPTRHGSTTSDPAPAKVDSPAVARLRAAGAIILGKTTLPEFGWKGITDSRLQGGATRNPWNTARSPGGSSGGAAAALAAGIGTLAFGNDGGGSIRIPCSFCGLYGLKPTTGRVPHHPMEGVFATLVAGGPIARRVADAAAMLSVMAQPDDRDWYALPAPAPGWLDGIAPRLAGLRIGYAPELGGVKAAPEVRESLDRAVTTLRDAGAMIEEIGPVISPLEETFGRFWIGGFANRLRMIPRERWDELDSGYRDLAEAGMSVRIEEVLTAEAARAALWRQFAELYRRYDLLLTPTTPEPAPPVETIYHGPGYSRWRAIGYVLPFNLTGQPAATIPCGLTRGGLPIGLQLVGPRYTEALLLAASLGVEQALGGWPKVASLAGMSVE
jgi:aspartyl-tRNA(Asn)/glutamyl-tRNA(Gln) amidotransferase subunit A